MPRSGWVKPVSDRRLSDLVSVGVLTRVFPPDLVDEVIAAAGRTEQGLKAITACAPGHAARVRELSVDVLGPDRLALLGEASNDVVHAIAEHQKTSCPPEVQGYC
jgi:Insertion element 4 transposase N-terminal